MRSGRLPDILWGVSLFALALAASTGVLLRFGLYLGMPGWTSSYAAVRHAHSHLMYFGWVTVALMGLVWSCLPRWTGRPLPKGVGWQMILTSVFALLSYPAFWPNGYGLTQVGAAELPLGSMVSALGGLTWILFVALYLRATWGIGARPLPIQLWDWAVILMLVAFSGALGLVGLVVTGNRSPLWEQFFLHQFLDLFGVGWFGVALLGVLWAHLGLQGDGLPRWLPSMSLGILLAPTFVLGMSPGGVTGPMLWLAILANAGAAVLLARHWKALWPRRGQLPVLGQFGLAIFAIHIATAFVLLWPGFWQWSAGTQLRVFYLHDFLLGWVSSALLALVWLQVGPPPRRLAVTCTALWVTGVAAMLVALLGLGFVQFVPVAPITLLRVAAWASVPVAGAATLVWVWFVVRWMRPARGAPAA